MIIFFNIVLVIFIHISKFSSESIYWLFHVGRKFLINWNWWYDMFCPLSSLSILWIISLSIILNSISIFSQLNFPSDNNLITSLPNSFQIRLLLAYSISFCLLPFPSFWWWSKFPAPMSINRLAFFYNSLFRLLIAFIFFCCCIKYLK